MLSSKPAIAVAGLSLCGITGYLIYLFLKKEEDKCLEKSSKKSNYKTLEVFIPKEFVRVLIGPNGTNIKSIQEETHTRISFKDAEDVKVRICVIRGSQGACLHAQNLIQEFIVKQPTLKEDEMYVPQNCVPKIIGRCGERIFEMSTKSGAKMYFADNDRSTPVRKLFLKGTEEQISIAKGLVEEVVHESEMSQSQIELSLSKREPRGQAKSPTPTLEIESPKVERMSPTLGQDRQFEVYISAMVDPSHFWLQIVGPKATQLDQLVEDMTEYYGKEENRSVHILKSLDSGDLVAAVFKFDKKWYRAEVLRVVHDKGLEPLAELYYVDYGDTDFVPFKELFELRTDFLRLNFQAIECYLARVEPKDGSWSNEASDKFEEWAHVAQWKKLSAKMNGYCIREKVRATREGSPVPGVDLYDVNNDRDIDIAEELVNHGYAVFKKETDAKS